ncbi:MAG: hypothetical protein PHD97_13435 [Bacteroidales bacterium]|nr:hypothetical protein [Bacteroidales bacterium]
MTSSEYIDKFIINQANKLQEQESFLASIMVLTIGIEVLGGFFDKKPIKSPKQSKLRFKMAIDKLLGGKYAELNRDDYLYEALRNQLVHSLMISRYITLSDSEKHLSMLGKSILFNPKDFLDDMEKAVTKLKQLLAEGNAFEKRIPDHAEDIMKIVI